MQRRIHESSGMNPAYSELKVNLGGYVGGEKKLKTVVTLSYYHPGLAMKKHTFNDMTDETVILDSDKKIINENLDLYYKYKYGEEEYHFRIHFFKTGSQKLWDKWVVPQFGKPTCRLGYAIGQNQLNDNEPLIELLKYIKTFKKEDKDKGGSKRKSRKKRKSSRRTPKKRRKTKEKEERKI